MRQFRVTSSLDPVVLSRQQNGKESRGGFGRIPVLNSFCPTMLLPKYQWATASKRYIGGERLKGLSLVVVQSADRVFAQHLVDQGALPQIAFTDAVHIAVSAIRAIPYLATWNFAHLANPHTRPKIEQVCRQCWSCNALHRHPRYNIGGTLSCMTKF